MSAFITLRNTLLLPLALLAACSGYVGTARDFDPQRLETEPGWLQAPGIVPILQKAEKDCGAAVIAMALTYWGDPTTMEAVLTGCPITPEGLKAGDLRDFVRKQGLKAFLFHGTLSDLEKELSHQRPVVVGMVKPHLTGGLTHYEVVAALHLAQRCVVTLDPAQGWRINSFEGFDAEWNPTGRLTLVLFTSSSTQEQDK